MENDTTILVRCIFIAKISAYTYQPTVDHFTKNPSSIIEVAPKVVCRDTHHMETFFQDVVDKGGEGIILRDPTAPYESGRSKGYLKHKVR